MRALINIDYTSDFIADEGKLTTAQAGQAIEEAIVRVTEQFIQQGDYVVFAIDRHEASDPFHPENRLFPPHNLVGTPGRQLYGQLGALYERIQSNASVYWLDKRHYSAFSGTDLDIRLRERAIQEIHLVGVCTDICILHTAIDAYHRGYQIVIHKNAVASFDAVGHTWALNHFVNVLGASVV